LKQWLDDCPNSLYSILSNRGAGGWRARLTRDLGDTSGLRELLDEHDDEALHTLMTNLGGHDLETILQAFHGVEGDRPTCFLAYTLKGRGLPFAGHKDNHAGLMTVEQMDVFRRQMGIAEGEEWEPLAGLDLPSDVLKAAIADAPFNQPLERRLTPPRIAVPARFDTPSGAKMSTQEGFGKILTTLARQESELVDHIVTTSADVTVSTNMGAWVNRRGVFDRANRGDVFAEHQVLSPQKWALSPRGQHIELGIAESSLFTMLGALGLSGSLFGARLFPIGTLYDPFISRGLDALNYAC
jgi:pyruvate dehydrogenase E1 component